jgi:hypothetical protein
MIGLALATGACTTYGVIENKPLLPGEGNPGYSLGEFATKLNRQSDELTLAVAFSGGGTRAADSHQLRPGRRTGGPADRRRPRAAAQQRGIPAIAGQPAGASRSGRAELDGAVPIAARGL